MVKRYSSFQQTNQIKDNSNTNDNSHLTDEKISKLLENLKKFELYFQTKNPLRNSLLIETANLFHTPFKEEKKKKEKDNKNKKKSSLKPSDREEIIIQIQNLCNVFLKKNISQKNKEVIQSIKKQL